MSDPRTTRERLIETGLRAMLAHGYEGVGIGPILLETGVPKGSFYHYFASKDDFAIAVVDAYAAHYEALRRSLFQDAARDPIARLHAYFEVLEQELVTAFPNGGCLYGMLSQTIAARGTALQERLSEAFRAWQRSLQELLEEAKALGRIAPGSDTARIAALIVDAYEGVLLRIKAEMNPALFSHFRDHLDLLLGRAA